MNSGANTIIRDDVDRKNKSRNWEMSIISGSIKNVIQNAKIAFYSTYNM